MKIFRLVTAIILCLAVLAGIVFAAVNMRNRPCSSYELVINYDGEYPAVKEAEILQTIEDNHIEIIGVPRKDIDFDQIAQRLKEISYIKEDIKFQFLNTKLRIMVTMKNILLHVYAQNGNQYFVDEDGFILPFYPAITENVPIANGKISDIAVKNDTLKHVKDCDKNLQRVFRIAAYMNNDDFYRAQFRQLYVTENNEVILVPTIGRHKVIFGTDKDMEEKLFNLKQAYQQGLAYMGMDQYTTLDVRYKNRVIAKKR